ncbi:hypothetical protein AAFG07_34450 [Bradyrhizobium sp. B097]|uniref:hypothetical protein n=1 Tax=Bradyrhizobium sp. B097 TaxID=3140244 RepID=UPI00318429AD
MLAFGLVLNTLGIGLFCWAIFALAVHALPFFLALSIGTTALQGGAGVAGALLIGTAGGAMALVFGQAAVASTRSLTLRFAIASAFAVPAAVAGYHVVSALSQIGVPSLAWREVFACLGALYIGGASWVRLTAFTESGAFEQAGLVGRPSRPILTGARRGDDRSPPSSSNRLA